VIFHSRDVLSLPILSLVPRVVLLILLLLLFGWMERRVPHRAVALACIGVPLTLMLTTTDTLAFLNSFYQEGASLIYALMTFACLIVLRIRPSWRYLIGTFVSVLLLATSKPAYCYWPFLVTPFVYVIWKRRDRFQARVVFVIAMLASLMLVVSMTGARSRNSYHSLFYGALTFSTDPASHLQRLGMEELADRIGDRAYASVGSVSFLHTLTVIAHEPALPGRMLMHVTDRMQDASLDYLGKYAIDDPRSASSPMVPFGMEERHWGAKTFNPLNAWSTIKYAAFPTGVALLVVLACFVFWFLISPGLLPSCPEISLAGLVATLGCGVDMLVAILGDGKFELIKHLFLANVLFDIAAIAFISSAVLSLLRLRDRTERVQLRVHGLPDLRRNHRRSKYRLRRQIANFLASHAAFH
jgi:hypothetical protein